MDLQLNNLRIVLKWMIYDVANSYYRERVLANAELSEILRLFNYELVIPENQINFMLSATYAFRRRFRNRRQRRDAESIYQYKFRIEFLIDDLDDDRSKTLVLDFARGQLSHVEHFLTTTFNSRENELNLYVLDLAYQGFCALYECSRERLPANYDKRDVLIAGNRLAERWSSYFESLGLFLLQWHTRYLQQVRRMNLSEAVEGRDEEEEEEAERAARQYSETRVIESPGLSVRVLRRLLDTGVDDSAARVLRTVWTVRVGFTVSAEKLRARWLRNVNLASSNLQQNRRWRALLWR